MYTEIGVVAGGILNLLEDKNQPLTINEIKLYIDAPADLVTMALGWLIREKFIRVSGIHGDSIIFLSPQKAATERRFPRDMLAFI